MQFTASSIKFISPVIFVSYAFVLNFEIAVPLFFFQFWLTNLKNITFHISRLFILAFSISDVMDDLYKMKNEKTGNPQPMISDFHYKIIMDNAEKLNSAIIYDRDFSYNYFGFKASFMIAS